MDRSSPRDLSISIAKGLGMAFVVAGHYRGGPTFYPLFPYAFHMPLFFFLSGLLCQDRHFEAPASFLIRRIRGIGIPFLIYFLLLSLVGTGLSAVTHENFGSWQLFNWRLIFIESFIAGPVAPLFFTGWFLTSLLVVSIAALIVYQLARYFKVSDYAVGAVLLVLSILSIYFGQTPHPTGAARIVNLLVCKNIVALFFFWCGHALSSRPDIQTRFKSTTTALIAWIGQYALVMTGITTGFFVAQNSYSSLWAPFVSSLFGICFVLAVSSLTAKGAGANDLLVRIGDNSVHVMALHPLALELIAAILMTANGVPIEQLSLSTIYGSEAYWPVFLIGGLILPVVAIEVFRRLRSALLNRFWLSVRATRPAATMET